VSEAGGSGQFEAALAAGESGNAWEGLGWAGWWLHDADLTTLMWRSPAREWLLRCGAERSVRVEAASVAVRGADLVHQREPCA
jgi:hypothetical protein